MTRVFAMLLAGGLGVWAAPPILLAEEDEEEVIEGEPGQNERGRVSMSVKNAPAHKVREIMDEHEAVEYLKANAPDLHQRFAKARGHRRAEFRDRIRELAHMRRDPEMRKRALETMKAHIQVQELAEQYRQAEDKKEKEALKKKLEAGLSESFDVQLKNHELRIKKMQEEIGKMQEKISKRRSMKEKLVKKRLDRITGEDEDEEW